MNILFQCNTVYQLMTAMQIKDKFYENDRCDFLLSDIMNDYCEIGKRLTEVGFVNSVYKQEIKKIKFNRIKKIIVRFTPLNKYICCDDIKKNKYDLLLFSNPSINNISLYQQLKKKNKNIEMKFYEDGLSTYSKHLEKLYLLNTKGIKNFIKKNNILSYSNEIFVFEDKFFMWKPKQKITIIPKIRNDNMLKIFNIVFGYSNDILPKDCKSIFFEESYFADGKNVNDLEIINKCADIFGHDGFYVKIHPRNRINRFEKTNIKLIPTSSIPWEILVLNNIEKIREIKLITIASSAVFTTNYLFGIEPNSYSCINVINDKNILFKHIPEVQIEMLKTYKNISYIETLPEWNNE